MIGQTPVVSVIIPVYNAEKYLVRCLDSVLAQSFSSLEIICINDGSTDSSLDILQSYASRDARIKIIHQENRGIAAARNAGLNEACGQYISFVDSDDALLPNLYETVFSSDSDKADAICFSAQEVLEGSNTPLFSSDYFEVKFSGLVDMTDDDLFKLSATVWDKIFLRKNIETVGLRFPEGVWYEDNAFVWNYFSLFRKAYFRREKLYLYYRRAGSFMSRNKERQEGLAFHYIRILKTIYNFWTLHRLLPEKQDVFERLCLFLFRAALNSCNNWEVSGIVYQMSLCLHKWNFTPKNPAFLSMKNGDISLKLGRFPFYTDIYSLKNLHGLEKIFYIGNSGQYKLIRIFGVKVFCWNRSHYN